jgi:polynucleotide 5'-hydroxyl-kinase GRC3/NOL9
MIDAGSIVPGPGWEAGLDRLAGDTVLVVGAADRGKSSLARHLARLGAARGRRVALVSADVGQPSVGVPACLAVALGPPWETPAALWFVGDVTPVRHLLPIVVGTGELVRRAHAAGADLVVVDTDGLVHGGLGRAVKWHLALAARATDVLAVARGGEIDPLLDLLAVPGRAVRRVPPSPAARLRSPAERRAWRERAFRTHFRDATRQRVAPHRVVGADGGPRPPDAALAPGTLLGLLDGQRTCLGLGRVVAATSRAVEIVASPRAGAAATVFQVGARRVLADGREVRASAPGESAAPARRARRSGARAAARRPRPDGGAFGAPDRRRG